MESPPTRMVVANPTTRGHGSRAGAGRQDHVRLVVGADLHRKGSSFMPRCGGATGLGGPRWCVG
jgi:hypothetical protein